MGVGNADFDAMERLDADDNPLRHSRTGKVMEQCIVKFVPFNEFKNEHISVIAKETLDEIPEQVTNYMARHKIRPNSSVMVSERESVHSAGTNVTYPLRPPTAPVSDL